MKSVIKNRIAKLEARSKRLEMMFDEAEKNPVKDTAFTKGLFAGKMIEIDEEIRFLKSLIF